MNNIHPILFIKNISHSLFIRLIAGFLFIVLILVSLTFYAISISKENARQEVVKYNTLMLSNARDSYEKHLDLIRKQMVLFFFSEEVQLMAKKTNYVNLSLIQKSITTWTTNPYLFIDNILFYSKRDELVLEKSTSTNADLMFNVFYRSDEYPIEFWRQQFTESDSSRVLPAANISNYMFRDRPQLLGKFIPIVIKNQENSDFYMVVFLDAAKMYKAFHQGISDFMIYDSAGITIFKSVNEESFNDFKDWQKKGNAFIQGEKYHFQAVGDGTGFTYVDRVPVNQIANQTRLNVTLVVMIVTAITLSVLFSFLFAARVNNPLKKVIDSIRQMNDNVPFRSSIKEFNIISDNIQDNQLILKQFSFINHVKAIRNQNPDSMKLEFANKPFVLILFQIHEMSDVDNVQAALLQNWLYYCKIYIESQIKPKFADSLTFQIERNQILSLVYSEQSAEVLELLVQIKDVFNHDKEHALVTMALTPVYSDVAQLTKAYAEAQELVGERLLSNESQIIQKRITQVAIGFSADQDKAFEIHLREGNTSQLLELMERVFGKWKGKELPAAAMMRFADSMIGKIRNAIPPNHLDPDRLEAILSKAVERIRRCSTVPELERLMLEWVTQTADAVHEKKQEKYPITSMAIDYINEHLAEEIYLDVLADKLKMSSSYLSTYFKAKTGKNIVDYINETRIDKATGLLADNQMKIHAVSKAVGYQNVASFNRMFKKYTGVTPSEYRKRNEMSS
ncbi:helix-turn-helix domain-containing protein [Paenibacillus sp. LMG 31461]|uniref:Helix-turn-helix domain-containing protein n=1 Tax=Paenibacillus plantarum TaxID=2654975 RepID=A0ABX1XEE1_9BACL|nr:AraC family transcriptional regulator [Paenibacillus plantarum]NOU66406.1 helix-turn-helix domain-containing protein [Paenibacillus plantarum]